MNYLWFKQYLYIVLSTAIVLDIPIDNLDVYGLLFIEINKTLLGTTNIDVFGSNNIKINNIKIEHIDTDKNINIELTPYSDYGFFKEKSIKRTYTP